MLNLKMLLHKQSGIFALILVFSVSSVFAFGQKLPEKDSLIAEKLISVIDHYTKNGNIVGTAQYHEKLAVTYWKNSFYIKAEHHYLQALNIYVKNDNDKAIASVCVNIAHVLSDNDRPQDALNYLTRAETLCKKLGMEDQVLDIQKDKAIQLKALKNYPDATQNALSALQIAEKVKDKQNIRECYGILAELYKLAGNDAKSLEYYDKFWATSEISKDTRNSTRNDPKNNTRTNTKTETAERVHNSDEHKNVIEYIEIISEKDSLITETPESIADTTTKVVEDELKNNDDLLHEKKLKRRKALIFALTFLVTIATVTFVISQKKHSRNKKRYKKTN